ncbi:secretion protein [Oecophyllibacter saccharovorans]|uniref:TolC family outer membrane protein n=1 Tax=Oecophyllibacter saccharovorans TaxID=2558360 RepID=UPI0011447C18|nr:TolC family outer membrane protein [Oecophyllibacter saccharovorans]QDH14682.1 secretion protein [Oecophyllibacter saccharovorans]
MSRKVLFSTLTVAACLPHLASAAPVPVIRKQIDLRQALISAYQTNPELLRQRALLRQTDEGVSQAHSGWRPTITGNATADYNQTNYVSHIASPLSGKNFRYTQRFAAPGYNTGVTVSEPIFQGGKTVASTRKAVNQVYAGRAQLINTEQQVFLETVQAYVNLLRSRQLLELNRQNEITLAKQAQLAEEQFQYNQNTRTDVLQARSQHKSAQADTLQAQSDYAIAKSQFQKVVGFMPPDNVVPARPLALPLRSSQEAEMLALTQNPNMIGAKYALEAEKANLKVAFSALLPKISMQGSYNYGVNQDSSKFTQDSEYVAIQANLPIYQGGAEYSQIRAARQGISAAQQALAEQRRDVIQSTVAAWQKFAADTSKYVDNQKSVLLGEAAFKSIQQQELLGVRTTFEVLQQQQILFGQQRALIQNHADLVIDSYALAAQIGQLTAEGLKLQTPLYNPRANYDRVKWKMIGTR